MAILQGIDNGTTRVRKVTIKGSWGKFTDAGTEKPAKKVMTIPSHLLTFRQFTFPFHDKKRIREILPGELMESMIFPIDRVVWDASSIVKDKANTLIVTKEALKDFEDTYGASAQVIDAEPCALSRVAKYNNAPNSLIIDFGAHKTSFYGIKDGRLDMVRVRMLGGDRLDEEITGGKDISPEKIFELKSEKGMSDPVVREFVKNLIQSSALSKPLNYEKIFITGGGSLIPGIKEYIEETFELPVEYFTLPEGFSPQFDAVAFGAALFDSVGDDRVNLKEHKDTAKKGMNLWLLIIALIPFILFSISIKVQELQLAGEARMLNNSISEIVRKTFPQLGKLKKPVSQVRQIVKGSGSGAPGMKVIDVMSNIAKARQGVDVNIYEIDISGSEVKLRGETADFQSVDKLKASLSKLFPDIDVNDQKKKPDGKVDFILKVETKKVESKTESRSKK